MTYFVKQYKPLTVDPNDLGIIVTKPFSDRSEAESVMALLTKAYPQFTFIVVSRDEK